MKKSILFSILCLVTGFTALAQSTSWTGAADSVWANASNWTSGVPTQTVDAVIGDANFTGSNEPAITAAAACRALTVASGHTLEVATGSELQISGCLTNNGVITGDSLQVIFTGTSTIEGAGTAVYKKFKVASGASIILNKPISIKGDLIIDGTFSTGSNSVTFSGSSASSLSGTSAVTLSIVILNKPASSLTLQTPLTVTGTLTLTEGIIHTTATNLLSLADDATASAGSSASYVDGPVKKIGNDAFVFPLGAGGVWARLAITAPSVATDAFTAQYFASAYSNTDSLNGVNNVSKVEHWNCERSAGTSTVNIELYWEDNARSGISDYNDLVVARWNGSKWENGGQLSVVSGTQGKISSLSQSSFGFFTLGSGSGLNVLPITLVNFEAFLNQQMQVELAWETETEVNNNYFSLERSADGTTFETIAMVKGAGTSTTKHAYTAIDKQPLSGLAYYRLRQVDFNGLMTISAITTVDIRPAVEDMEVYPNPANGDAFAIAFKDLPGTEVKVAVCNEMGGTVYERTFSGELESSFIAIAPAAPIMAGMYWVIVSSGNSVYKRKLVIR